MFGDDVCESFFVSVLVGPLVDVQPAFDHDFGSFVNPFFREIRVLAPMDDVNPCGFVGPFAIDARSFFDCDGIVHARSVRRSFWFLANMAGEKNFVHFTISIFGV
jgi:hypothetical protein